MAMLIVIFIFLSNRIFLNNVYSEKGESLVGVLLLSVIWVLQYTLFLMERLKDTEVPSEILAENNNYYYGDY